MMNIDKQSKIIILLVFLFIGFLLGMCIADITATPVEYGPNERTVNELLDHAYKVIEDKLN